MAARAVPGAAATRAARANVDETGAEPAARSASKRAAPARRAATSSEQEAPASEAPEQAGERLASHLDMLAETVRAIVTHVMQPNSAAAQQCECCSAGECTAVGQSQQGSGDGPTQEPSQEETSSSTTAAATASATTTGRTEYSLEVRELVVAKHAAGASYKAIASELGMPSTTVQTIVKRAKQQGGVVTAAQRAGRPRVTNESVERTIREMVAQHPGWSAREVLEAVMASHQGIAVSFETIRRRVRDCRKQLNENTASAVTDQATESSGSSRAVGVSEAVDDDVDENENGNEVDMDTYASSEEMDREQGDLSVADTDVEMSAATAGSSESPPTTPAGKTRRKRGSEYSPEFREMCVQMHEKDGKSYQAIALELDIPPDSVRAIVRKAKRTGSVVTAPRSGRPRKTTDLIDRVILQSVKNSQRSTAKQIQDDLWTIYQVKVSCETIRRRVRDHTKMRLQTADSAPVQPPTALHLPAPTAMPPMSASTFTNAPPRAVNVVRRTVRAVATHNDQLSASFASLATTEAASSEPAAPRSLKRKRSEYPIDVREKCVELHGQGMGYRKIGEELNMPHTTVRAIVEKVQRTGSMLPAPRSGRPRKTDEILDKVILQTVKTNDKCSARMIQEELETAFDVKVSCETIRRRVKDYMRQKHLFAESSAQLTETSALDDEAMNARRVSAALRVAATPSLAELELQQQQQQQQQQQESMLLMAEITQPFHPDGMVSAPPDVRNVPQSLMEMMTAAAAAAAAVSTQHHQQAPASQQQQQQHALQQLQFQQALPLMPAPFGFGFAHSLHQPHSQAMQAMLDEALATQPPAAPTSPPPMSEFVL